MGTWEVSFKMRNGKDGKRTVKANSANDAEMKAKKLVGQNWAYRWSIKLVK